MDRQNSANTQLLIQLINGHSNRIKNRTITCATTVCCHCGLDAANSQIPFIFHGTRVRRFLVLVGSYVRRVAALLARWRCPRCHTTFTDYPPFACPYKAYTLPQMAERAGKYVSNKSISYRTGVCSENLPIFYEEHYPGQFGPSGCCDVIPNLATMAHTSLFRWVTTLGGNPRQQPKTVPADFAPATHKFTSEERRSVLIACRATCSVVLSDGAPVLLTL
jgi:hypothetical protein